MLLFAAILLFSGLLPWSFETALAAQTRQNQSALYTMADLEALERQKNHSEFFQHAKDIRPSQRGKLWQDMVLSMADLYLKDLEGKVSINEKDFRRVTEISQWAPLKEDEFYAKKRNKLALHYLEQCLDRQGKEACHARMLKFFNVFDKNKEFGFQLAQAFHSGTSKNDIDLWHFVSPMAQSAFGEFYCDKTPLFELLVEKVNASSNLKGIAHKDCLESAGAKARSMLESGDLALRSEAFSMLEKLGKLRPSEVSQRLVTQMLGGFALEKDKWSKAFKALQQMGENSTAREELLKKLSELDTLPDGLFSQTSRKRSLVLTKQLAKNFPEYLDFYTNRCLEWLSGDGEFPKGNPTPNCHQYFKMAKIIGTSPAPVTRRYEKIMNSWKK